MYKILVLNNTNLSKESFDTVVQFLKTYNINIEFEFKNIIIIPSIKERSQIQAFNSVTGKPALVSYYSVDDFTKYKCLQQYDASKYESVLFWWNIDILNIPKIGTQVITSWSDSDGFMQVATNQYDIDTDVLWKKISHEILHDLCFFLKRKGIPVVDEMDKTVLAGIVIPFYKNDDPFALDGNYAHTLKNIKPFINKLYPVKPDVIITRHTDDGVQTLGDIQIGTIFSRATLERPFKDNKPNISCISKGIYTCRWTFSPRLMKYTYEVLKVPSRSGIRFHKGNFFFDIEGCILLGTGFKDINHDGKVDIINSTKTIKEFETLMAKKDFILQIK